MNFSSMVAVLSSLGIIFLLTCIGIWGFFWTKKTSYQKQSVKISFSKEINESPLAYMEFEKAKEAIDNTKTPDIIPTNGSK